MSDQPPINLNKVRKASDRVTAKETAARNRVAHGRTKAEKQAAATATKLADRKLDQSRRER